MSTPSRDDRLCDGLFALCTLLVLCWGVRTTGDLAWPYDIDLYREIGKTFNILDGQFGADFAYAGERQWYNPMVHVIVATLSRLSSLPVPAFYTQAGAWLNLLAPIAFYLLAVRLLDRRAALAASICFLFVNGARFANGTSATYSPWLFVAFFAQALFYLSVLFYLKTAAANTWRWWIGSGVALGLVFMTHTAPAVLLGGIMVLDSLCRWRSEDKTTRQQRGVRLLVALVVAFVVSLPFGASILGHYGLHIVNPEPTRWLDASLRLSALPAFLLSRLAPDTALAMVALVALCRRPVNDHSRVLFLWTGLAAVFLAYGFGQQWLFERGLNVPTVVPAHHAAFYVDGALALWVGVGITIVWEAAWRRWRPAAPTAPSALPYVLAMACLVAMLFPSYSQRDDFVKHRETAINIQSEAEIDMFNWLRANTEPRDTVLTDDVLAHSVVTVAGRKVVCLQVWFSNPYVDFKRRQQDRQTMFQHLLAKDWPALTQLAASYKLRYVLVKRALPLDKEAPLHQVHQSDELRLYRLRQ